MKKKIVVFGVGVVVDMIYNKIDFSKVEILGFVNPYTFKADNIKEFKGHIVYDIEALRGMQYDFLLIASGNVSNVKAKIAEVGLDVDKAVAFAVDSDNDVYYAHLAEMINQSYAAFLNDEHLPEIVPSYKRNTLFPVTTIYSSNESLAQSRDFVRHKQLEFIAQSIYDRGIEGSVAECGVYKGEFAKRINQCFPDRNLYLFDTFEGFDIRSIKSELSKGSTLESCGGGGDIDSLQIKFLDTNVDYVLGRMPFREKCIVKKGFFPETFDLDSNEKFVFVSLDMDLYQPILDGLRVFYPRLAKGGFMMIHDYNNLGYPRCKEAVDLFCKESGAIVVPLTDFLGSALIVKQ